MTFYNTYSPDNYSFSFEEAAIILKPLLDTENFIAFLIRKKYLNELAQPKEEWIKNKVFSFAPIVVEDSDYYDQAVISPVSTQNDMVQDLDIHHLTSLSQLLRYATSASDGVGLLEGWLCAKMIPVACAFKAVCITILGSIIVPVIPPLEISAIPRTAFLLFRRRILNSSWCSIVSLFQCSHNTLNASAECRICTRFDAGILLL
jgi:hypothetical protein